MKNFFAITSLVSVFFVAAAQEIEFPLSCNPVIKEFLRKQKSQDNTAAKRMHSSLALPFMDDFSGSGIFPDPLLWIDSDAFVNQTMCDNPPTIGVATLDGINKYGQPHDSNSTAVQPVICDYLTSQPIDLFNLSDSDSVYFGFYYQPQGLGDEPEEGDSLVLQFYGSDGIDSAWTNVWVAMGRPDSAFQNVRIKIDSAAYFWGGFQFRFFNYATPNGNRDHWNIDYVTLRPNETRVQALNDIALVYPIQSYLKEFSAMPYKHYKDDVANGNNPVKSEVTDTVRVHEFASGTTSIGARFSIDDRFGTNILTHLIQPPDLLNPVFHTDYPVTDTLPPAIFPSTNADFTDYYIKHSIEALGVITGPKRNDTSMAVQHFYNYYAYDDGSAESATGVHVAYTKYAYKVDVKTADLLIGISIYFNPWGKNVHQDLFSLCMWDNINVGTNSDVLVTQTIDQKPANNDSINGFVDYYLDTPMTVTAGVHYFGIIQSSVNEIGIGVDHNTDSHDKMLLNYNNLWYQSTITGSWLMRPMFGKKNTIGVNEIEDVRFDVFPNPSATSVIVETSALNAVTELSLYNMIGEKMLTKTIASAQTRTMLDISSLPEGVYFIQLSIQGKIFPEIKKLVVTR